MTVALVMGFLLVIGVIAGVLASFLAHGVLWDMFRPSVAGTAAGIGGGAACAGIVFVFLYALNPDPREDGRADPGNTAVMTAVSAFVWLPLYLYAFTGIARRYRRRATE